MADDTTRTEEIQKVGELIQGIKIAMLTTAGADGALYSRPMMTQDTEFDGTLWFFTGASTPKVGEIQSDAHVNVSYADADHNRYVSVAGRVNLVRDREKAKEFWNPAYKAWFPDGLDDPDLILLKVDVDSAEYWDSPHGSVVHAIGFAKALVTGQRYEGGENEKISL